MDLWRAAPLALAAALGRRLRRGRAGLQAMETRVAVAEKTVALTPGPMGPMPRHEIKGKRIRFEQAPGVWGEWIALAQYSFAGGGGIDEARVMQLAGGGGGGGNEASITIEYVSATDNRPSRIVRDQSEDRFDWATGAAGTYQYKGTAPAGSSTAASVWTVIRTTLDSLARPIVRQKLVGQIWNNRVTLLWP